MNGMLLFYKTSQDLWNIANAILRRTCNESAERARETSRTFPAPTRKSVGRKPGQNALDSEFVDRCRVGEGRQLQAF